MTQPSDPQPRQRRYTIRHQARLDAETHATLEQLVKTFRRKRGPILRYVMQWGISRSARWSIDQSIPAQVHLVPLLVEPELLQQVQDAAAVHGATVVAWVRHAIRQISGADFPPSWHAEADQGGKPRSHDSRYYVTRFMLRLDKTTTHKLQHLVEQFAKPRAEIIRQLVAQAKPEDFPKSWQLAAEESRVRRAPPRNSQQSMPTGPRRQQP